MDEVRFGNRRRNHDHRHVVREAPLLAPVEEAGPAQPDDLPSFAEAQ